jgi:hypothetical protein
VKSDTVWSRERIEQHIHRAVGAQTINALKGYFFGRIIGLLFQTIRRVGEVKIAFVVKNRVVRAVQTFAVPE